MAELINREWLQKEFNTRHFDTYDDKETVFMTINEAPTIKKQSVGRWLYKHNPITDPKGYFISPSAIYTRGSGQTIARNAGHRWRRDNEQREQAHY